MLVLVAAYLIFAISSSIQIPEPTDDKSLATDDKEGVTEIKQENTLTGTELLKQQLEAAGWQVQEESDGSLSFQFPQQQPETEAEQQSDAVIPAEETERLKEQLEAAGWQVQEESDGSLSYKFPEQPMEEEVTPSEQD